MTTKWQYVRQIVFGLVTVVLIGWFIASAIYLSTLYKSVYLKGSEDSPAKLDWNDEDSKTVCGNTTDTAPERHSARENIRILWQTFLYMTWVITLVTGMMVLGKLFNWYRMGKSPVNVNVEVVGVNIPENVITYAEVQRFFSRMEVWLIMFVFLLQVLTALPFFFNSLFVAISLNAGCVTDPPLSSGSTYTNIIRMNGGESLKWSIGTAITTVALVSFVLIVDASQDDDPQKRNGNGNNNRPEREPLMRPQPQEYSRVNAPLAHIVSSQNRQRQANASHQPGPKNFYFAGGNPV